MKFRIPNITTVVVRDGKRVVPKVGVKFKFNDAEIRDLDAVYPGGLSRVVAEDSDEDVPQQAPRGETVEDDDDDRELPVQEAPGVTVPATKTAAQKAAAKAAAAKAAAKTDDDDGL